MKELKVDDKVYVTDPGLAALRKFAPKGAKPNHHGTVAGIWTDGTILVEFPLSGGQSQVAPYPPEQVKLLPEK